MGTLEDHLIDEEKRSILSDEYSAKNYTVINNARGEEGPDSRFYTFDLAVMEEFLQYVKDAAEAGNLEDVKIRISMGQYPENAVIDERQDPLYKGYQTIFIEGGTIDGEEFVPISGIDGLDFSTLIPPHNFK